MIGGFQKGSSMNHHHDGQPVWVWLDGQDHENFLGVRSADKMHRHIYIYVYA